MERSRCAATFSAPLALTLLVVMALVWTTAARPIPPAGPDLLGLYTAADETGQANVNAGPGTIVTAYLLLTGCSSATGISGWECTIEVPRQVFVSSWVLAGLGLNIAGGPTYVQGPNSAVGLPAPLPPAEVILLCEMNIVVFNTSPAYFFLRPVQDVPSIPGSMAYAPALDIGNLTTCGWSSGDESYAVFGINTGPLPHVDGGTIPTVAISWGNVKALYR